MEKHLNYKNSNLPSSEQSEQIKTQSSTISSPIFSINFLLYNLENAQKVAKKCDFSADLLTKFCNSFHINIEGQIYQLRNTVI